MSHARMYSPRLATVADRPPQLFEYGLSTHDAMVRNAVPLIELGFSDAEVWDAWFDDETRLRIFRMVHGNRKGPKRKPKPPTLFEEGATNG